MTYRRVLHYPNANLKLSSASVDTFDEELRLLVKDMIDTCNVENGVGLAAPQIGVKKRVVVIKPAAFNSENPEPNDYNGDYLVLVNPSLQISGETVSWKEGCLSVPDVVGDVELTELQGELLPMLVACQPAVAMIRFQAKPAEAEKLQNGLMAARMPKAITSIDTPMLDGGSLESTCDDDSKLFERTVMMRIVEQYDALVSKGQGIIDEAYQIAKLEPLPMLKPSSADIETLANEDLNRVDCSDLDAESLIYLLQRAQQVSATPTVRRVAKQLIGAELSDEQKPAKMLAYMTLINASQGNEQAIELMDEAKAFAEANNIPTANLLLSEVGLRLSAGDGPGFQKAVETLSRQYGNEPEVMAKLQQTLMAYGLIGPDGTPRQAPGATAPAAQQSGGGELWTPETGSPAPETGGAGGGGKLWVPGMD